MKFKEAGVYFEKEIIPPDLSVDVDLELVEQVIINLIQNAPEAIQDIPDPRLSLSAGKNDSGQVQINVTDNGPALCMIMFPNLLWNGYIYR
ncbi:MAG: hypothetical protein WAV93_07415 [Bacteroidales bacterium]